MLRWVALVLGLAACGKSEAQCRREVADVAEYFATLDTTDPPVFAYGTTLVVRDDLTLRTGPNAPVVEVRATETRVGGRTFSSDELAEIHSDGSATAKDPDLLYVAIEPTVPWERVRLLLKDAEQAGYIHPMLVFGRPMTQGPPPPSKVDQQIDAILAKDDAANKATEIAGLAMEVIKGCPALKTLFGQVGSDERGSKAEILVMGTPPALLECECAADPASVRNILARIILGSPLVALLPVTFAADGVTIAPTTTWADASKTLQPGAKLRVQ
jgi:hypothetical protein